MSVSIILENVYSFESSCDLKYILMNKKKNYYLLKTNKKIPSFLIRRSFLPFFTSILVFEEKKLITDFSCNHFVSGKDIRRGLEKCTILLG